MTEKLFEQNVLLKSCQSKVVDCLEKDSKYFIELDKTVFFPEGGGQLSDKGKLGDAVVSHVCEKDGRIYHECDKPLAVGGEVKAELDWSVRLDRMQQHLGEHLLSYACWKLFGANNVGFHMSEDIVTIDLDKELTPEELEQAEHFTNEIIWENRPVTVTYLDSTEAAKLPMRKFNSKLTGVLRIVAVDGADVCTCCGTHPPFTGMIGSVKIIRCEKHKEGQRIEFACGRRALLDADMKNKTLLEAGAELSSKPEEVPARIVKLKTDIAALQETVKEKTSALLDVKLAEAYAQAKTCGNGVKFLCIIARDNMESKLLLSKVTATENAVSIILTAQPQRISYVAAAGKAADVDCREYVKRLNEAFEGRGGGKQDCAQGGAAYCDDWECRLEKVISSIISK